MVYVYSLNAFLLLGLILSFRAFQRFHRGQISYGLAAREAAMVMIPSITFAGPLVLEVVKVAQFQNGGVALDGAAWHLWFTALGSLLGLASFGWRVWRQRNVAAGFFAVGANIAGLLICLYMAFVVVDQVVFFGSGDDAGTANLAFFREIGQVTDIQCESGTIIIKGVENDEVAYRCPMNIMLGKFSSKPFVPWPSYTEGKSKQLAVAWRKVNEQALKL